MIMLSENKQLSEKLYFDVFSFHLMFNYSTEVYIEKYKKYGEIFKNATIANLEEQKLFYTSGNLKGCNNYHIKFSYQDSEDKERFFNIQFRIDDKHDASIALSTTNYYGRHVSSHITKIVEYTDKLEKKFNELISSL